MTDLKLVDDDKDIEQFEEMAFSMLRGKKFIAIYYDENHDIKQHQCRLSDEEKCWLLNIALYKLMEE